jgi:DNA-directed RNA polymerase subunit RPC12/RpoP
MKYCSQCGTKLEESMKFCPECGQRLIMEKGEPSQQKPDDVRTETVTIERADPTYYSDEKGVRVTATRLIIPKTTGSITYAMANITSIHTKPVYPTRSLGIILAVVGVIMMSIGPAFDFWPSTLALGVALLIIGIILAVRREYHLKVTSAAGEEEPLRSNDRKYINQIAVAVNEALIKRG